MTEVPTALSSETTVDRSQDMYWMAIGWSIVCPLVFLGAAISAYRPSFDTPAAVGLAALPIVVLVATMTTVLAPLRSFKPLVYQFALAISIGGWTILMLDDYRWWFLTFILYGVSFSASPMLNRGPEAGLFLAGIVTVIWTIGFALSDEPRWLLMIPGAVFVIGSIIALTIYRVEVRNAQQADLIQQLTATRHALAAAERSKGVLEERARFASEIHDTLTQGFASIVLLSRAAQRTNGADESWASVETTAVENLDAARRLVDAVRPAELDTVSLVDALDRQINALPEHVAAHFQVVGDPRPLGGSVEVVLFRAAQEALLNVKKHAEADNVHVTLSYLDDEVALDIRDDGVGFAPGDVHDRGELTGGQGLRALEERARSLSGRLTIEALETGGSVVSLLVPVAAP